MTDTGSGADQPSGSDDAVDAIVSQWAHERPDLDPSPIALFGRVHRIYLRYQSVLTQVFGRHDLNSASFDVLAALRRAGAPYRKAGRDLASGSLLSSAGVTFRLDRLEAAGLITRQRDAEDRRVVYSQLTDRGLEVINRAIEDHLHAENALLHHLTKEERAELARLLSKLERSIVEADFDTDGEVAS
ncbi:MarR family transcriptional regulator [Nocardioides sp. NBC_00163]|uniref:MarR family winged helix-turn-helix transcriptional regulator n=1 Tax=unclassified Nocardioides TaxID=2615069 RepID=UPI00324C557B